jgi:hypothetical protein
VKRLVVVLACVAVAVGASAAGSAPPREGPPDQIDHTNAAVGWDGTNYLVLWDEFDVTKKTDDTRGARVRPDGTVLDPAGLEIVPGRIVRAHCSVGRVRRTRSRRVGVVIAQTPRPRARRPAGTRVNLVVGRR